MEKILLILLNFLYFIIIDILFFGLTAKYYGKKCQYNCKDCENWACTHETEYEKKPCYPVRDWSWWCGKKNKKD